MLCSLVARSCREPRKSALLEVAPERAAICIPGLAPVPPPEDDVVLAAQLGIDVATYRMLKQLEQREIMPEDYDLLGRLDEAVKPATLTFEDLQRFPMKVHSGAWNSTVEGVQRSFGIDFWRLPVQALSDDKLEVCAECEFFPVPDDDSDVATSADASSLSDSSHVCGVCLLDFAVGDELRNLPCGHSFHRECIDHWLLNSSTMCPIDKRDVRQH